MSILVELIANGITSIGIFAGMAKARSALSKKQYKEQKTLHKKRNSPDEFGAWPWHALYLKSESRDFWNGRTYSIDHFTCPKCQRGIQMKPLICEEEHYIAPHFHFICTECSYKCILRTADDTVEPEED